MRTRWIFVVLLLLQQIRCAQISQAPESWSGLEGECIFISFWFELDSFQFESFNLPVWLVCYVSIFLTIEAHRFDGNVPFQSCHALSFQIDMFLASVQIPDVSRRCLCMSVSAIPSICCSPPFTVEPVYKPWCSTHL